MKRVSLKKAWETSPFSEVHTGMSDLEVEHKHGLNFSFTHIHRDSKVKLTNKACSCPWTDFRISAGMSLLGNYSVLGIVGVKDSISCIYSTFPLNSVMRKLHLRGHTAIQPVFFQLGRVGKK